MILSIFFRRAPEIIIGNDLNKNSDLGSTVVFVNGDDDEIISLTPLFFMTIRRR